MSFHLFFFFPFLKNELSCDRTFFLILKQKAQSNSQPFPFSLLLFSKRVCKKKGQEGFYPFSSPTQLLFYGGKKRNDSSPLPPPSQVFFFIEKKIVYFFFCTAVAIFDGSFGDAGMNLFFEMTKLEAFFC